MKTAWYVIKNVALAIGITAIGSYMASDINSAILWILGIYLIFAGLSTIGQTNIWVTIIIILIGVGLISLGQTVLKEGETSYYLSAVFIALIALGQLKKLFQSYGTKKWQKILMKLLTLTYPVFLISGAVFAVFFHDVGRAAGFFSVGSLLWILHTVFVVLLKCIPSGRKITNKKHSGSVSSQSKVAQEMSALANYFTGGYDVLPYSTMVTYSVSAKVVGEEITFIVSGTLSGGNGITTEQQINGVKNALESAVRKRQNLILEKSGSKLESINPDSDYTINVVSGNFS